MRTKEKGQVKLDGYTGESLDVDTMTIRDHADGHHADGAALKQFLATQNSAFPTPAEEEVPDTDEPMTEEGLDLAPFNPDDLLNDGAREMSDFIIGRSQPLYEPDSRMFGVVRRSSLRFFHALKDFRRNRAEYLELAEARQYMQGRVWSVNFGEGHTNDQRTHLLQRSGNRLSALAQSLWFHAWILFVLALVTAFPWFANHALPLASKPWRGTFVTVCMIIAPSLLLVVGPYFWWRANARLKEDRQRFGPTYAAMPNPTKQNDAGNWLLQSAPDDSAALNGPDRLVGSYHKEAGRRAEADGVEVVEDTEADVFYATNLQNAFLRFLNRVDNSLLWKAFLGLRIQRVFWGLLFWVRPSTVEPFFRGFYFDYPRARGLEVDTLTLAQEFFPHKDCLDMTAESEDSITACLYHWLPEASLVDDMQRSLIRDGHLTGADIQHHGRSNGERSGRRHAHANDAFRAITSPITDIGDPANLSIRLLRLDWWADALRTALASGAMRALVEVLWRLLLGAAPMVALGVVSSFFGTTSWGKLVSSFSPTGWTALLLFLWFVLVVAGAVAQGLANAFGSLNAEVGRFINSR